ncbi:hypothetical protein K2173_011857 [Erythroxylum novogranatense]|uniref:Reverse transcriptase Ty1/copia-type domain-containing protein n=1 Tax=Erythroxylum novogranatense TaxID=1862640 RepID=A0AAV8S7M0_9ROSI|nr:hypothetical protein K2173_011857 [Erythroxylum novogranatense]
MELEWGDNIKRNPNEEKETVEVIDGAENDSPGRNRRPLVGSANYTCGEGLLEEDEANMVNMAIMMTSDPTSFEKVKIGVKWIYKTKLNEFGEICNYKARLVVKGYTQQHGIDYIEVYALVARMDTVRTIIAFVAQR